MSGSGRKSAYRKGVTKRVLYGDPEPKKNERIVRVTALRGTNLFEVIDAQGAKSVTMLPTKFRKLIWVKRGDFLIVGEGDGGEATTATGKKGAVTSIVVHILYKDQIKNLKQKGLWPVEFNVVSTKQAWTHVDDEEEQEDEKDDEDADEQVSQVSTASSSKELTMVEDGFAHMHVNRNRRKGYFDDEEEEADSDDE